MVSAQVRILSSQGLHLRPAGNLAEHALKYESSVMLSRGDKEVSAKSLLGVLSLCVRHNSEITITCDGSDEETALAGMIDFVEKL